MKYECLLVLSLLPVNMILSVASLWQVVIGSSGWSLK